MRCFKIIQLSTNRLLIISLYWSQQDPRRLFFIKPFRVKSIKTLEHQHQQKHQQQQQLSGNISNNNNNLTSFRRRKSDQSPAASSSRCWKLNLSTRSWKKSQMTKKKKNCEVNLFLVHHHTSSTTKKSSFLFRCREKLFPS